MLLHDNVVRQPLSELPRSSSDDAFCAGSAREWRSIISKDITSQNTRPSVYSMSNDLQTEFPAMSSEFDLYVLLQRIGSLVQESLHPMASQPQTPFACEKMLRRWMEAYQRTSEFRNQEPSLKTLWHSIFMGLNADMDSLECASGREGNGVMMEHQAHAKQWARSSRARKCVVHSVLLQRQFETMSLGSEPPIHAAASLYRCGIAWYCFARFARGERLGPDDCNDMPELRSMGIDGNKILLEDVSARLSVSVESGVVKIVDLLQRITHWKVADTLASTLLALIDAGQGLSSI